jgi:phage baseplate assembly protein W
MPNREFSSVPPLAESTLRAIGKGLSFPFNFSSTGRSHQLAVAQGVDKINQSIFMILSTRIGERMFFPEFGSRLPELVFEPDDDILHVLLAIWTADALRRWEKRITVTGVSTTDDPDNNTVGIQIDYTINLTYTKGSYVFPFTRGGLPLSETVTKSII